MSKSLLALLCCVSVFGYAAPASASVLYEVLRRSADPQVSADGSVVVGAAAGISYRWTLSPSGVTREFLPILGTPHLYGTNRDGSVIVGFTDRHAFRWTAAGGTQILGAPFGTAQDVSSDGEAVVGEFDGQAYLWTELGLEGGLGFLPGTTRSRANAIAGDDGLIIVGFSTPPTQPFRWTPGAGMRSLGSLPGREGPGLARGISNNGDAIVGQFGFEAFRWTEHTGMVGLGFVPDSILDGSQAFDVSFDGETIVGNGWAEQGIQAMRFTAQDGMTALGDLPGGAQPFSFAFGVSADGLTIVGRGDLDGETRAFIWRSGLGMQNLQELLEVGFGLKDMAGWTLVEARAVSTFGTTIVGWGTHNGIEEGWMALLPNPCPPDLNHDGIVGIEDMLAMLKVFGACINCMNCPADLNSNCQVDNADLIVLLAAWGPCS